MSEHKKAQVKHCQKRAMQRYRVELSSHDIGVMGSLIRRKLGVLILRQSGTRSIYEIEWKGTVFRVVYHSGTRSIATFLDPKMNGIPRIQS